MTLAEAHYEQAVAHLQGGRHALALVEAKRALDAAGQGKTAASVLTSSSTAAGHHHSARYWLALAEAAVGLDLLETAYAVYAKGLRACLEVRAATSPSCEASADAPGISTAGCISTAPAEQEALKKLSTGRMEVLAAMALGKGAQAAERSARHYSMWAQRSRMGIQVFCASDLHVDAPGGEALAWLRAISTTRFQQDAIIVAGDVADTAPAVRAALCLLKARFGRVFYLPGNHDLWLRRDAGGDAVLHADSFCKLMALRQVCDELGVETAPAEVAAGLFVVPLLSWYNHTFDTGDPRPGRLQFDKFCKWPVSAEDVWQVMLKLNTPALAPPQLRQGQGLQRQHSGLGQQQRQQGEQRQQQGQQALQAERQGQQHNRSCYKWAPDDVVITASHFLPHTGLPFSRCVSELAKAVGCQELGLQLDQCGSDLHIYGHTHINGIHELGEGASRRRYVQFAVEAALAQGSRQPPRLCCVWDGQKLTTDMVDAD